MLRNAILLLAMLVSTSLLAATSYVAIPLGSIGGVSFPYAINATGDVTGYAYTPIPFSRAQAFLYSVGSMKSLGSIEGPYSYGVAINARDQVAGYGVTGDVSSTGDSILFAFLYADGVMQDIGTLGGRGAKATGINDQGKITGWSAIEGDTTEHAFVYANGVMTDIGTLSGGTFSEGDAINAAGQVTGRASLPSADPQAQIEHAFLYDGATMHDLGSLSGASGQSVGYAITDQGDITGASSLAKPPGNGNPVFHAFIHSGGSMRDIGTLGGSYVDSYGYGINSAGQVVGVSTNDLGDLQRAFVYSDGAIHDLNDVVVSGLGAATLTEARGINESGQIVATGCSANLGLCQAFRLHPVPAHPVIPDPVPVVEFHYPPFDHYFMTADPVEIAALDAGAFPGWVRTGQSFNAYATPTVGAGQVCRFFNDSFAPESSHFYSADPNECLYVKLDPMDWRWQFEGITMYIPTPDVQGQCPANTRPVYRLYNNGMGGAPNHRYTANLDIRSQMIAQGWASEGYGPQGVIMCAPQ